MKTTVGQYDGRLLKDIVGWDIATWKRALSVWDRLLGDVAGAKVLDIGARRGGLSLYFALKGCTVICSDLGGPSPEATTLHERYGVADRVTYRDIDVTKIALPDDTFDIVCFKSVLGSLDRVGGPKAHLCAVREMHRVLKPGGWLAIAENMASSRLHAYLRRRFVPWAARWRYLTYDEVPELLAPFRESRVIFHGFLATFGRREWQRAMLHLLDVFLVPLLPNASRYLMIGAAMK